MRRCTCAAWNSGGVAFYGLERCTSVKYRGDIQIWDGTSNSLLALALVKGSQLVCNYGCKVFLIYQILGLAADQWMINLINAEEIYR
mmetsp:Transcript_14318/g.28580  ORF Transcript_14318/g.28580 Transcript_14318/m.28580 type:complete len:87 (+) Transcript_14318:105-365(+)